MIKHLMKNPINSSSLQNFFIVIKIEKDIKNFHESNALNFWLLAATAVAAADDHYYYFLLFDLMRGLISVVLRNMQGLLKCITLELRANLPCNIQ